MFRVLLPILFIFSYSISQTRYLDEVFDEVTKTEDIIYGNAPDLPFLFLFEWNTENVDLDMDIYEPTGDTLTNRPVIIFIHSGAFFSGYNEVDDVVALSITSAKRGYVAVSMNYRLGINILSSYSGERAVYRGVQDASAVVRYLREFYQDYGIDYENIFIWGTSAGSFIGLHLAFVEDDERLLSTYGSDEDPDLGCIDCEGNDYIHNSKPKAVISCWGALVDLDMIDQENNIPTIMFHGTLDPVVLFNSGYPFTGIITLPIVYGSNLIHERLNELHIQNALYFEEGQLHEYWGTLNGNWFGGPNEYYYQILDNSYAHLFTLLQSYQIGDVNTDGNVGIADILLIYDFIHGNLQLLGIQYSLADYDSNGIVNSLDANILINTILNFN